jgi:hypothetical protein
MNYTMTHGSTNIIKTELKGIISKIMIWSRTPASHTVYSIENMSRNVKEKLHNMMVNFARLKHTIYLIPTYQTTRNHNLEVRIMN